MRTRSAGVMVFAISLAALAFQWPLTAQVPISGRICSWVSSRSCSGVWAGTERVVAERRRLVMDQSRFLFFWGRPL